MKRVVDARSNEVVIFQEGRARCGMASSFSAASPHPTPPPAVRSTLSVLATNALEVFALAVSGKTAVAAVLPAETLDLL